jgi:hypothetical protein
MEDDDIMGACRTAVHIKHNRPLKLYCMTGGMKPTGPEDISNVEPGVLRHLSKSAPPLIVVACDGDQILVTTCNLSCGNG